MQRRTLMLGLGALSAGSGATIVTGAFDGDATVDGGDGLRTISSAEINLNPGDEHDDEIDDIEDGEFEDLDLPLSNVEEVDGELEIEIVTAINASDTTFDELFEVEVAGTEPVEVTVSANAADEIDGENIEDEDDLQDDIEDAYGFEIGEEEEDNSAQINPSDGEITKSVDLTVDLTGVVGELRSKGIGTPGGNPFDDGGTSQTASLVDSIEITADLVEDES